MNSETYGVIRYGLRRRRKEFFPVKMLRRRYKSGRKRGHVRMVVLRPGAVTMRYTPLPRQRRRRKVRGFDRLRSRKR